MPAISNHLDCPKSAHNAVDGSSHFPASLFDRIGRFRLRLDQVACRRRRHGRLSLRLFLTALLFLFFRGRDGVPALRVGKYRPVSPSGPEPRSMLKSDCSRWNKRDGRPVQPTISRTLIRCEQSSRARSSGGYTLILFSYTPASRLYTVHTGSTVLRY